jgi:hypothetical protein
MTVVGLTVTACFLGLPLVRFAVFMQLLAGLDRFNPSATSAPPVSRTGQPSLSEARSAQ